MDGDKVAIVKFPSSGGHLVFIPWNCRSSTLPGASVDPVKSKACPKIHEPGQLRDPSPLHWVSFWSQWQGNKPLPKALRKGVPGTVGFIRRENKGGMNLFSRVVHFWIRCWILCVKAFSNHYAPNKGNTSVPCGCDCNSPVGLLTSNQSQMVMYHNKIIIFFLNIMRCCDFIWVSRRLCSKSQIRKPAEY
jgi:hypothetical protein